jgi:hypothetical protein
VTGDRASGRAAVLVAGHGTLEARTVTQPLGAATITASFAGDPCDEPAADSAPIVISAVPAGGALVIGDAAPGPASEPASGPQ